MRGETFIFLCVLLAGCSTGSPSDFVKLDASGKVDASVSGEAIQRDFADCQVLKDQVRSEQGAVFSGRTAQNAFDNCMRSKGYVKS